MAEDENLKKIMLNAKKLAQKSQSDQQQPGTETVQKLEKEEIKEKPKKEVIKKEEKAEEFPYALNFQLTEEELLDYYLDDKFSKTFHIKDRYSFSLRLSNTIENLLFQLVLSYLLHKEDAYINMATFNILRLFISLRFTLLDINGEKIYQPVDKKYREDLLNMLYSMGLSEDSKPNSVMELKNKKMDEFLDDFYENDLKPYINLFAEKPSMLMNIIGDTNAKLNKMLQQTDVIKNF
ncbi:MAG: hypothetical protein PWQ59_1650 [Thermoanaerobacterium sp.]|nr:hypothetical protein [Thermoanaerobacterium sp.]